MKRPRAPSINRRLRSRHRLRESAGGGPGPDHVGTSDSAITPRSLGRRTRRPRSSWGVAVRIDACLTRLAAMELRHLRYFVAAPEEFHLRRAAERLLVAQRSLSEQVRTHEPELGVRRFARGPPQRFVHRRRRRDARPGAGAWSSGPTPRSAPPARRTSPRSAASGSATCPTPSRPPSRGSYALLGAGFGGSASRSRPARRAPPARERPGEGRIDVAVTCLPAPVSGPRGLTIGEEGSVAAVPQDHPCANRAEIDLTWLERTALRTAVRRRQPGLL